MAKLTINGRPYTVNVAPDTPLLWVIREHLQLTGTKFGCGAALCGACTVHLDGAAVRSCHVPVSQAGGKKITTISHGRRRAGRHHHRARAQQRDLRGHRARVRSVPLLPDRVLAAIQQKK